MSINNSAASRRDDTTREVCRSLPEDPLARRIDIDHVLSNQGPRLAKRSIDWLLRCRKTDVLNALGRSV